MLRPTRCDCGGSRFFIGSDDKDMGLLFQCCQCGFSFVLILEPVDFARFEKLIEPISVK